MKRSPRLTAALSVLLVSSSYGQNQRTPRLSDNDIELEVQQALVDPAFNGSSIMSTVTGGVVKLYGNVRSNDEKTLAESKITSLRGVKSINDLLSVVDRTTTPVASSTPAPLPPKTVTVPQGTGISIRLTGEIDTKNAAAGDSFTGTTAASISNAGAVVIPTGTPVTGRVIEAKAAGRLSGAAVLSIELVSIKLPTPAGQPQDVSIVTKPLSSKDKGNGTGTATKTAGGAGLGAVIGAIAGGGRGAGIGAASGGAVGLGASALTPGKQIDLKPEALLQFQTEAAFDITPQTQGGQQFTSQNADRPALLAHGANNTPGTGLIDIPNQTDPATFDILTLRLGMTAKEAAAAISTRIPGIQPAYPSPGDAQFTPGKRYTTVALYTTARFKTLLTFTESYPFDPTRPEQLTTINYQAVAPTEADRQQFRDSILTKYGQPYRETKAVSALWCNKGVSLGSGPLACALDVPVLQLKGSELILSDSGPYHREKTAWNTQTNGAPPI